MVSVGRGMRKKKRMMLYLEDLVGSKDCLFSCPWFNEHQNLLDVRFLEKLQLVRKPSERNLLLPPVLV